MANKKISQLASGNPPQSADEIPINRAGANFSITAGALATRTGMVSATIDGGGSAVGTGSKGQLNIPFNAVITGWVLTADQVGAAVVDVQACPYAGFPGSLASICGGDKPALAPSPPEQRAENLAVSLWTTALAPGTQLNFNVLSATAVTRLNLTIILQITG